MKKILLATLLFLVPCVGFAHNEEGDDIIVDDRGVFFQAPDYQLIKDSIGDPNGHYYYPRLLERLAQGDTTLDITSDVQVLETMMANEGLTETAATMSSLRATGGK